MEIEQHPHLSSSLVKQVTTSKLKGNMNTKDSINPNLRKHGKVLGTLQVDQQPTQQQHKKPVRRRIHLNRPYQERPLNMAEARREIVTALKYHRAAMKQASTEQKQQQLQRHLSSFEQDGRFKSRTNPNIYPSCTTNFSNYMDGFCYSSSFSHAPPSIPNSYTTPITSKLPHPTPLAENLNFTLPNHTSGLNLNLHNVNNLKATFFLNNNNNNSSLSSSSPPPVLTNQKVSSIGISQGEGVSSVLDTVGSTNGGLHIAMDDEGMAEIKALGEQYQMEWNDTMNLVTSAWWFNFLKRMENGVHQVNNNEDVAYHYIFDELMEFPAWLNNANKSCLEQCSEDCFQDPMIFPW